MTQDDSGMSDEERFRELLDAAKGGSKDAMNLLGECYENGRGTKASPIKALFWYQEASLSGNWDAQLNLQSMISTLGCTQDDLREIQYNMRKRLID